MLTIAILGFGARGQIYNEIIQNSPDRMRLVAVCDVSPQARASAQKYLPQNMIFSDYQSLYRCGKIADMLIIATQDKDHYVHTMAALDLGYDILLEKPISPSREECEEIKNRAEELGRRVAVCHVLRYTPYYSKIKQIIDGGSIGKVVTLSQTENVGYWHQAHSFVRGHWRNSEESSPMILAKCCHDLDIIRWLVGVDCKRISSFGGLEYFKKENQPEGASDYCYQCAVPCPYNALDIYKKRRELISAIGAESPSDEEIDKRLSCQTNPYARCVFVCDNDVVDHQIVNMQFEQGITAQLTMTAFSQECHRNIKIHGTLGEIEGDMEDKTIKIRVFGKREEIVDVTTLAEDFSFHGGGDRLMLLDFASYIENKTGSGKTLISDSVQSHLMAFDAEKSRLMNGVPVDLR